ncbi:MAG: hypothetical protein QOC98_615 [Frankiaceae bacterium]|nr:hypothetical protein [Frankiaceae bacterium]
MSTSPFRGWHSRPMTWEFTSDVARFVTQVRPSLGEDPVANTVLLTLIEDLRRGGRWSAESMLFGWYRDAAAISGAIIMTRPQELVLTAMPSEAVLELAGALLSRDIPITEVNGDAATVDAFAATWTRDAPARAVVSMRHRLYRLATLHAPSVPAGSVRSAVQQDRPWLVVWFTRFVQEAGLAVADVRPWVGDQVDEGRLRLWQDGAGAPVSLAGRHRTAAGVARIGPVFTPIQQRRHGYGTAVTVACVRDALRRGAEQVVLFADLANPTSIALYQQIGFLPLSDYSFVEFIPR